MISDVIIVDDFLPASWHNALRYEALKYLQYKYDDCTADRSFADQNTFDVGQFVCEILVFGQPKEHIKFNDYFPSLMPIQYMAQNYLEDILLIQPVRLKFNLMTQRPDAPINSYNTPHHDAISDCVSMLYYLNDSDGDTVFFNEKAADGSPEAFTIKGRVTPKANRAVIFDSSMYHASSQPRETAQRNVLNCIYRAQKLNG